MRKMLALILFAVALAACGQSGQGPTAAGSATAAPAAPDQPSAAATTPPAATSGAPEPTAPATGSPATSGPSAPSSVPRQPTSQPQPGGGLSVAPPAGLVEAAQRQLARYLKLAPEQVVLQSANKQEWPDGALGCPQPGMAYPQVLTEGFRLIFTNPAQTASYDVHTAMGPAQMVLCQDGKAADLSVAENSAAAAPPPGETAPVDPAATPAVDAAKAALAQEIGVKPEQIAVVSVEPVEWGDSSMGCPQPGRVYLQVITPGYRVVLEAQGQRYEYHTDSGKNAARCKA